MSGIAILQSGVSQTLIETLPLLLFIVLLLVIARPLLEVMP